MFYCLLSEVGSDYPHAVLLLSSYSGCNLCSYYSRNLVSKDENMVLTTLKSLSMHHPCLTKPEGIPRSAWGACVGFPKAINRKSCTCALCTSGDSPTYINVNSFRLLKVAKDWLGLVILCSRLQGTPG